MLSKVEKQNVVKDLSARFKTLPSIVVIEYKGLNVGGMEKLRKQLKEVDAELRVVKNTLLKRASKKTDVEQISDLFIGPTAVAISGDENSTKLAKIFVDSINDFPTLKIKGGLIEGKVVCLSEIEKISKFQSREELIAQFIGLLKTPMSNFVGTVKQMQTKLVYALSAVKDNKNKEK